MLNSKALTEVDNTTFLSEVSHLVVLLFVEDCSPFGNKKDEKSIPFLVTEMHKGAATLIEKSLMGLIRTLVSSMIYVDDGLPFLLVSEGGNFDKKIINAMKYRVGPNFGLPHISTKIAEGLHEQVSLSVLSRETWRIVAGKGKSLYLEAIKTEELEPIRLPRKRAKANVSHLPNLTHNN